MLTRILFSCMYADDALQNVFDVLARLNGGYLRWSASLPLPRHRAFVNVIIAYSLLCPLSYLPPPLPWFPGGFKNSYAIYAVHHEALHQLPHSRIAINACGYLSYMLDEVDRHHRPLKKFENSSKTCPPVVILSLAIPSCPPPRRH